MGFIKLFYNRNLVWSAKSRTFQDYGFLNDNKIQSIFVEQFISHYRLQDIYYTITYSSNKQLISNDGPCDWDIAYTRLAKTILSFCKGTDQVWKKALFIQQVIN